MGIEMKNKIFKRFFTKLILFLSPKGLKKFVQDNFDFFFVL